MYTKTQVAIIVLIFASLGGCATAPSEKKQGGLLSQANATKSWFEQAVVGLDEQIVDSAGYVIFPNVTQWGIVVSGGQVGRGAVYRPDGTQIGWARMNVASVGLQAGVQGFRMLMVLQSEAAMDKFKNKSLSGSVNGVLVAGTAGGSAKSQFRHGVTIYEGANGGLKVGVNIGLNIISYQPLESG